MIKYFASLSFILICLLGSSQTNQIEFVEYDLPNGLHVILHEDHSTPITAVTVMYHVGSKNENPERTGMAHFFEHLLFEGSENIGRGEFASYVENAGGVLNANTTTDRTFYYDLLPSNQLELGLWLESERMLHAKVDSLGIATQREVVKEEKRLRYDNQPYGYLLPTAMDLSFEKHPYKWTPIGSMEHLDAATDQEFMDFYKKFYVPNNAVLSIAGDLDINKTKKLIAKYFGDIPKGVGAIPRPTIVEPAKTKEVREIVYSDDQLPLILQAYHIPAQGTDAYYAVDMLNQILSGGSSSRLNQSLVENQQLCIFSGAISLPYEDPGLTLSFALANAGIDPSIVETAMDVEIDKVKSVLVSDREFEKIRNMMENAFVSGNSTMAGIAETLANYHMYLGDTNLINTELQKYLAVTKEDIMSAANTYYTKENRVVIYFLNESEQK